MGLPKSSENFTIIALSFFPFFLGSIPLFDRKRPSLRPDLPPGRAPRAEAVQDAALAAPATPARSVLDSFEHGASLAQVGTTLRATSTCNPVVRQVQSVNVIRCEQFQGGTRAWLRATTLYSVDQDSDHDAVMRIDSEVLGGGPILSLGIGSHGSRAGHRRLGLFWHCTTLKRSMPNSVSTSC